MPKPWPPYPASITSPGRPIPAICCHVASLNPRASSMIVRTARGVLSRFKNSRVRSLSITCSWVKSKSMVSGSSARPHAVGARLARQLQHALTDDVLLNLRRARVNRARARPQEVVRPGAIVATHRARVERELAQQATLELAVWSQNLLHELLVP